MNYYSVLTLNKKNQLYVLAGLSNLIRTETPNDIIDDVKSLMRKILADVFECDKNIIHKSHPYYSYVKLSEFKVS